MHSCFFCSFNRPDDKSGLLDDFEEGFCYEKWKWKNYGNKNEKSVVVCI